MALLDTHAAVKEFVSVGLKEKQAEAITNVISRIDDKVANKSDLARLESIVSSDIKNLENNLKSEIALSVYKTKIELLKWIIPMFLTNILFMIGLWFR